MPTVLLVRHGQASFASADYDVLSDRGHRQAERVHAELTERGVRPARLVCGTLRRQRETAAPWLAAPGAPELSVDGRFDEYDAGDLLGAHSPAEASLEHPVGATGEPLSSRDFQALMDEALHRWVAAGADSAAAESWAGFRARTGAALDAVMAGLEKGETAVVLTSGGVIAALAVRVLGLPDAGLIAFNHVAVNGAVTKLVGGRRGISLISFNEHGHLEADGLVTYR